MMELRLLLCLTVFSLCLASGKGRPSPAPTTPKPLMEGPTALQRQDRPKDETLRPLTAPSTSQRPAQRWETNPGSTLQAAASQLNLASMVKNLMKDKRSAKKVYLLPGRVYMLPPEVALKGRRRYGGTGNKGYKYGGSAEVYSDEGYGTTEGSYVAGGLNYNDEGVEEVDNSGDNYLDGGNYETEDSYGMGENYGSYNEDSVAFGDEDEVSDAGNAGGTTQSYGQNGGQSAGYTEGNDAGEEAYGGGSGENAGGGGYTSGEQGYGNNENTNAQMNMRPAGDVPSNDIGTGSGGQYNAMSGEQFKARYDTLFREFVLNFFIKKYHLKTEMPP